jgi:quercetin dioxygenase-like cupin family protein
MKQLLIIAVLQCVGFSYSQTISSFEKTKPKESFENIHVKKISEDTLSSVFLIWVKDTVATHKHEYHSESIYVHSGEGKIYLNEGPAVTIRKGDVLFIPKNTWHAVKVTSDEPMRVMSVQSPRFDGHDRVFKK